MIFVILFFSVFAVPVFVLMVITAIGGTWHLGLSWPLLLTALAITLSGYGFAIRKLNGVRRGVVVLGLFVQVASLLVFFGFAFGCCVY
jgi:hypothetical protein